MSSLQTTYDDLLAWENDHDVLSFKFQYEGILLWPLIRFSIFSKIIENRVNYQYPHALGQGLKFSEKVKYLFRTIKNNPFWTKGNFDILFFGSTASVALKVDNKWFGRVNDYFVLEYEDQSLILDHSTRMQYRTPRYPKNVKYQDYIGLSSFLISKVAGKRNTKDLDTIKNLIDLLKESWGNQLKAPDYIDIENILKKFSLRAEYLHKSYVKLFKQLKPKIVFIEDASYGGLNAWIIKWAGDCGVVTGEPQHGCVDIPYIYSYKLYNHAEYKKYLPQHLLMYGQYWCDLVHSPSLKVIIGNPHFEAKRQEFAGFKNESETKRILIVSQGTVTHILVELASQLARQCEGQEYKIIFRLHPGEVPFVERYKKLEAFKNIQIDKQEDIYRLIHEADHIVGSYSLTLFEAAGLNKKIYVLKDDSSDAYIPKEIGIRFKDAQELLDLIKSDKGQEIIKGDIFWAEHWRENYRHFINSILENRGI